MICYGSPPYLECSAAGDRRFSAFHARLIQRGNSTIEDIYHAAKLYRTPQGPRLHTQLPSQYVKWRKPLNRPELVHLLHVLWDEYLTEHPELLIRLCEATGVSDRLGTSVYSSPATVLWALRMAHLSRVVQTPDDG